MTTNISNYKSVTDVFIIFFAILTVDVFVLFLVRYFPDFFGKSLNKWYDDFQLNAVLSDVLIILVGFLVARYVYTIWLNPIYGWNPLLFIGLVIAIQAIHDILFYLFVIRPLPVGHNSIIDLFKKYSEGGFKIVLGDGLLMLMSALVAFYYKSLNLETTVSINVLVLYALPYILNTRAQWIKN